MPIQSLDTSTGHYEVGVIVSIGILRDKRVQRFIRKTRREYGIEEPEDRKQKDQRLIEFQPERFLNVCREAAQSHVQRDLIRDIVTDFNSKTPPWWIALLNIFPFSLFRPYFMKVISKLVCLEDIVETAAHMLARHLVTGLYEIPLPTAFPCGLVRLVDVDQEMGVIVAVISAFSDLDAVTKQVRELYTHAFVPGQRDRIADNFAETACLRFCEQQLQHDPAFRRSPDQHLGAIAIELDLDFEAPDALDVKAYDALLSARADAVRKCIDNFDKAKQRFLTYRKDKRS
jgi:hypothetical protein